jgi:hypothetical protein
VTTYGFELNVDPTPIQVAVFAQETDARLDPVGMEEVGFQSVRSVVLTLVVPPSVAMPTATQLLDPAHDTEVRRSNDGCFRVLQREPAFSVAMIVGRESRTPTAIHVRASGHETPASESKSAGPSCDVHVEPSVVAAIPRPPTAVH